MTDDDHHCDSTVTDAGTDAANGAATARYDWTPSGKPSVTLAEAVAAVTDRAPTDLPPLQHTVDPDALDALLTHDHAAVSISFTYADTDVSVRGDGTIEVRVRDHARAARREE